MVNVEERLAKIREEFQIYHIPRYRELPDIDLYMDQAVVYLNKHLGIFLRNEDDSIVTSSMINNYVKHGIIPPPAGKKYTRRHLAYIVAVYFFKQVMKMEQIRDIVDHHVTNLQEEQAYAVFCEELENSFRSCVGEADKRSVKNNDFGFLSIQYTSISIASKLYAQKMIDLINEVRAEKDGSTERQAQKQLEKQQKIAAKAETKAEKKPGGKK